MGARVGRRAPAADTPPPSPHICTSMTTSPCCPVVRRREPARTWRHCHARESFPSPASQALRPGSLVVHAADCGRSAPSGARPAGRLRTSTHPARQAKHTHTQPSDGRLSLRLLGRARVEREVLVLAVVLKVVLVVRLLGNAGEELDGVGVELVADDEADVERVRGLGEQGEEGSGVEAVGRLVRLVDLARRGLDQVVGVVLPLDGDNLGEGRAGEARGTGGVRRRARSASCLVDGKRRGILGDSQSR